VRKEHALQRKGIGAGPETATAIAYVTAEVEPGPAINGVVGGRLRPDVGGGRRPFQQKHAERQACEGVFDGRFSQLAAPLHPDEILDQSCDIHLLAAGKPGR